MTFQAARTTPAPRRGASRHPGGRRHHHRSAGSAARQGVVGFHARGARGVGRGAAGAARARQCKAGPRRRLADVRLLAPLLYPPAIYCAGANYMAHAKEMSPDGKGVDKTTTQSYFFLKSGPALRDRPGESRSGCRRISKQVDWEGECAVVIGRRGRNVKARRRDEARRGLHLHERPLGARPLAPSRLAALEHRLVRPQEFRDRRADGAVDHARRPGRRHLCVPAQAVGERGEDAGHARLGPDLQRRPR